MSMVLYIIPAIIELILLLALRIVTKTSHKQSAESMFQVSGQMVSRKSMVSDTPAKSDMQAVLVRNAMIDTIIYIIFWGPFNIG